MKLLSSVDSSILKYWHPVKNGSLTPDDVTTGSAKEVWWQCEKGHEWKNKIWLEIKNKNHCPYCSGRKLLSGFNDLQTVYPDLAKEWDSEKNEITPDLVRANDLRKFWWKCPNGHSYKTNIYIRKRGTGCPYCAHRSTLTGFNDLASNRPDVMRFWDKEKNKQYDPSKIAIHSGKRLWWKCPKCGEEFSRCVQYMSDRGKCPKCKYSVEDEKLDK